MSQQVEPADGHILVAEDDADIRELIIAQLRSVPYTVSAADSIRRRWLESVP